MTRLKLLSFNDLKTRIRLCFLVFIVAFLSACNSSPKNTTLLYKDDSLAASELLWSPNGNELAISTNRGNPPVNSLYILNVETKQIRQIVDKDFGNFYLGSWSPDGKQLAFIDFSFKGQTWSVNSNGVRPPIVIRDGTQRAWLPNGDKVIARKDLYKQNVSLYIYDSNIHDEVRIFSEKGNGISKLSTSSDGSKLVFEFQKDAKNYGIYVFSASTKKTIQITPNGIFADPSFSPDGNLIAYTTGDETGFLPARILHIMKSDGSCNVEIPGHLNAFSPGWSPDGKEIAYIAPSNRGIYLLNLYNVFGKDITKDGLPCPSPAAPKPSN